MLGKVWRKKSLYSTLTGTYNEAASIKSIMGTARKLKTEQHDPIFSLLGICYVSHKNMLVIILEMLYVSDSSETELYLTMDLPRGQ